MFPDWAQTNCPIQISTFEAKCGFYPSFASSDPVSLLILPGGELLFPPNSSAIDLVGNGKEILRVLWQDGTLQLQVMLHPSSKTTTTQKRNTNDTHTLPVSIIVYGPIEAFEHVGRFFDECELFLQDPFGCDRNVPYHNPHRLTSNDAPRMTFELGSCPMQRKRVTELHYSDFLDDLISPESLPELPTPPSLHTSLLSCVLSSTSECTCLLTRHQRQALYFMKRRELGWALNESGRDVWTAAMLPSGLL